MNSGAFFCHGCGASGNVIQLLRDKEDWNLDSVKETKSSGNPREDITEELVDGWHEHLMGDSELLKQIRRRRGLTTKTLRKYQIGWDTRQRAYTIPIRDMQGFICNIRRWDPNPAEGRRKIWSVDGMGTPTLWPLDQLEDGQAIMICEGEWDALTCIQRGIPTITRTGGADHWKTEWNELFRGKRVYICHDMDEAGQKANTKVAASLRKYAREITIVELPFESTRKDGKDLSDYWAEGHDRGDFIELIREGESIETPIQKGEAEAVEVPVTVMDSFDAALVGSRLRMEATIAGKRIPSWMIPRSYALACDVSNGRKCDTCSMEPQRGQMKGTMDPTDRNILNLINVPDEAIGKTLRAIHGINSTCPRLQIDIMEFMTVEEVYVRPSLDDPNSAGDVTHRKILSAGSHDLTSNTTVNFTGAIWPSPKTQANEFVSWDMQRPPNALDSFAMGPEEIEAMKVFQTKGDPLEGLEEIADDWSENTTMIIGRPDLHILIDLTLHSALRFYLGGEEVIKGWLDTLIIGDTRTGKSEVAQRMLQVYRMGEMISCESASFAGVVGGLDRVGEGKWIIKWGSIPINDRRAVVLDEVSGLSTDQISQMSSIRSSGIAELTKIESEKAAARTRLCWLANPRNAGMSDYFYGVEAIAPLIGNQEDIARFDIAMGVFQDDVEASAINKFRPGGTPRYEEVALRTLLRWAWTREADQIIWGEGAEAEILRIATLLGNMYLEKPPLVQSANIRVKLARLAIAIATRLFSTDRSFKNVVVKKIHVRAAAQFLRRVYDHPRFGYGQASRFKQEETARTVSNLTQIIRFIRDTPNLTKFFRQQPSFTRYEIELSTGSSREVASIIIQQLWSMDAVNQNEGRITLHPAVLNELRKD